MKNTIIASEAVYIILAKEDKILIMRRCNTGYQDGIYQIPAGHIEMGELPTEAIIREAKEEIGITLSTVDLKMVHVSCRPKHDKTGNRVDFFFRATRWEGYVINAEPEKCDDLRWVKLDELPENMTPHVRLGIESAGKKIYGELDLAYLKSQPLYGLGS